jgi:Protein of unknown function (DUF664)
LPDQPSSSNFPNLQQTIFMSTTKKNTDRRNFIKTTATLTTAFTGITLFPQTGFSMNNLPADEINMIGPKEGFSPQVGTLVSMMNWMRSVVLRPVQNMTMEQLDFLFDQNSNTIGAMLLHLAATEKYYQLNTFDDMKWGSWDESIKKQWNAPMNLGDEGRKKIKGNKLEYYLDILKEVREKSLTEFKKRDDAWLLKADTSWGWGPTNNYCKWFHVVEHESNHNGQIKWIKSRLPGAKAGND